jgi:H+-transporting ATPase
MIAINVVLATLMAVFGWVMAPISFQSIIILLIITLIAMLILDGLKMWYYRVTGILGTERHS